MNTKLVIAKPGYNALTDTNPDHLRFDSQYNTLKYFMSGTWTLGINGNGSTQFVTKTIAHNLGYNPFFICFVDSGSGYFLIPRNENTVSANTLLYAGAYVDSTNLYLTLKCNWASPRVASVDYAYKIFKNDIGL